MIRIIKLDNLVYENIEPFYTDEDGNKIWNIPNNLDQLKQVYIDTVKWQANQKLKETDWIVVKCTELGLNPSDKYPEIIEQRQAIRDWSNQKEEEINNANSIDELLQLDIKYKR